MVLMHDTLSIIIIQKKSIIDTDIIRLSLGLAISRILFLSYKKSCYAKCTQNNCAAKFHITHTHKKYARNEMGMNA